MVETRDNDALQTLILLSGAALIMLVCLVALQDKVLSKPSEKAFGYPSFEEVYGQSKIESKGIYPGDLDNLEHTSCQPAIIYRETYNSSIFEIYCLPLCMKKIDINHASSIQLQLISGIGPSIAESIIETRQSLGGFGSIDDLYKTPSLSQELVGKLGEHFILPPDE